MKPNYTKVTLLLVLIAVFVRLWLFFDLPVSIDAATSFNSFYWLPVWKIIETYPAPNNHVLYSIFGHYLFGYGEWETQLIRIPSLIAGLLALWIFLRIVKENFTQRTSLFGLALFAVLWPVVYYSVIARGYSIILLMALVITWLLLHLDKRNVILKLILISLAIAIGNWAVPSFLYFIAPFGTAGFLFFIFRKRKLAILFALSVLVGLGLSFVLYMPIVRNEGWEALAGNRYVSSDEGVSISAWFQHFKAVGSWYLQVPWLIFLFLPLSLWLTLKKKNLLYSIALAVFIWMFITPFIHGVLPFERTWIHISPFIAIVVCGTVAEIPRFRYKSFLFGAIASGIIVYMAFLSVKRSYGIEGGGIAHKKLAIKLMKEGRGRVYLQEMYAQSYLPYHFNNLKEEYASDDFEMSLTVMGNKDFTATELDSIGQHYELIIMDNGLPTSDSLRALAIDTTHYYTLWMYK